MVQTRYRQLELDVIIFGGGIAGLWLLAHLRQQGFSAVLLERGALGAGQTRYAQGIIHGGTKYALTGKLSASAQAVAQMPSRWRACVEGQGELDLRAARILSEFQYLWSTANLTSRMAGFFASKLMKSRTRPVSPDAYPALFRHERFHGQVYQLDEPVLDTASLIRALAEPQRDYILKVSPEQLVLEDGAPATVQLEETGLTLKAKRLLLAAGKGNRDLLARLGRTQPPMQLRPLHMVALKGALPKIYAHCLGASANPRITITSHEDAEGAMVWYVGGQLAEEGVDRDAQSQIEAARKELAALFPWFDFSQCRWAALPIERAEVKQAGGGRPDTYFAEDDKGVITCWPTKLALAPLLADHVDALLREAGLMPSLKNQATQTNDELATALADVPRPAFAPLPWQETGIWN